MPESEFLICRICLREDSAAESMSPLFDEENNATELVGKLEEIGNIKVMPLDDIVSMLCFNCQDTLTSACRFRELCQESERTFASSAVKAEMKLEPVDEHSTVPMEEHAVEFVYQSENEFVAIDAEVEGYVDDVDIMLEERLEEEIEYEETVPAEQLPKASSQDRDMCESNTSDSDYDPCERVRKSKPRKARHHKRGRPRTSGLVKEEIDLVSNIKKEEHTNIMCEICGNIYSKRGALNIHMRRHMSEKPFECELCSKTFAGPSELSRHIRVHTGEKPFTCKYCSRAFADRSSNIRHERTHTNERPFTCLTCGKSFSYSNVLKNHMLTHTGEKPFLCLPCNKTFSRKHQLDQHHGTLTHMQTIQSFNALDEKLHNEIY